MAGSDKTWVDNNPPQLEAADLNGFKNEQNNLISGSGQAINTGDTQQQHKAVAYYSVVGNYYSDTGAANAYAATAPSPRTAAPALVDQMKIRILVANTNTGASTFDYATIGAKQVKLKGNQTLPAGILIAGQVAELTYDLGNDIWIFDGAHDLDMQAQTLAFGFASDADDTLTAIENLYGNIVISGSTLTAARNLVVSNSQRMFFVENNEGFAVTVKTSSGTGIIIQPGQKKKVYCDGVNVYFPEDPALLSEIIVSGAAQTTVSFTGLDSNVHKRYGIEIELINAVGSNIEINGYVNGDTTTTNYYSQEGNSTGVTPNSANANKAMIMNALANEEATYDGKLQVANGYPVFMGQFHKGRGASLYEGRLVQKKSATVSNLISVDFTSTVASSIGIGSAFRLYRGDN